MWFKELRHIDGIDISFLLLAICIALGNQFLLCYFGKLATESFDEMSVCLYNSNWELMPINLQRNLIIIMQNAQQPIYYHGFGIAVLNLQTFSKVFSFVFYFFFFLINLLWKENANEWKLIWLIAFFSVLTNNIHIFYVIQDNDKPMSE